MKKIKLILALTAILCFNQAYSQWTPSWYDFYDGGENYDRIYSSGTDAYGNLFVTGTIADWTQTSDWLTIKYDAAGNRIWTRGFDYAGQDDAAYKLKVDQNGDVYVTGYSRSVNGRVYLTTIKYYGSSGRIAWLNRHSSDEYGIFIGYDITVDQDGNSYVAGAINYGGYPIFVNVVKYDIYGQVQWERTFESFGELTIPRHLFIASTESGYIYVAGHKIGEKGYYLVKYNTDGDLIWENLYNYLDSREDYCLVGGMATDASDNVYLNGYSADPSANFTYYFTVKVNSSGDQNWGVVWGSSDEMPFNLGEGIVYSSSDFVSVTGISFDGNSNVANIVTVSYNSSNGSERWESSLEGEYWDGLSLSNTAITLDLFDNTWVAGTSSPANGPEGYLTAGYSSGGTLIASDIFYGDGSGADHPYTISTNVVLDPITNVFTGGMVSNATYDYGTVAYTYSSSSPMRVACEFDYKLGDNYPNPFNPSTTITFEIPVSSNVKISVYDINGRLVSTLADDRFEAGSHQVKWDGSNVSSGIYIYRLETGSFSVTKKMILLK